jgi:hypothetical protein
MSSPGHEGGDGGHFGGFDIANQGPAASHFQGQPHTKSDAPQPGQTDPAQAESATYVRNTRHGSRQMVRGRFIILTGAAIGVLLWIVIELVRMFMGK